MLQPALRRNSGDPESNQEHMNFHDDEASVPTPRRKLSASFNAPCLSGFDRWLASGDQSVIRALAGNHDNRDPSACKSVGCQVRQR
jgi:hypothetical protein